jgi:hypothetical protein
VVRILLALWIIIGLIVLLAIASLLPFSLRVRGSRYESFSYRTAFHWPWRALGIGVCRDAQGLHIQLLFGHRCLYERKKRGKPRKKRKEKEEKKAGAFNLLRDRRLLIQLIRSGLRFLRDLLSCFQRPRLAGDIEVGLADPAAMGIISGFVYAVSPRGMMLDNLRIRPNYIDVTFTGEVDFSTGARPARVIVVFVRSLFYFPIRGLLRLLRRRRRAARKKEVS